MPPPPDFGGRCFGEWHVIWGLGSGVWDLGFGIWGLGSGVWDMGSGIWVLGSRTMATVAENNGDSGREQWRRWPRLSIACLGDVENTFGSQVSIPYFFDDTPRGITTFGHVGSRKSFNNGRNLIRAAPLRASPRGTRGTRELFQSGVSAWGVSNNSELYIIQ